jgi:hypothetical protein
MYIAPIVTRYAEWQLLRGVPPQYLNIIFGGRRPYNNRHSAGAGRLTSFQTSNARILFCKPYMSLTIALNKTIYNRLP